MLLDQQGQGAVQDVGVVGVLDVDLDHLCQQRRLGPVEIVDASSIGHEAILFNKVEEVLNSVLGNLDKGATSAEQTLEDPVRVPVVRLSEPTTSNDKGAVDGDETVRTFCAVVGVAVVATGQVRPNVNDLFRKLLDDGIVNLVEELGIRLELVLGDFFKLAASIGKILIEKVCESRIVSERFFELVKCLLDLFQRSNGWPASVLVQVGH